MEELMYTPWIVQTHKDTTERCDAQVENALYFFQTDEVLPIEENI
jgi:hypothetical protein